MPEGKLTAFRSALVRKESLANASKKLGLGNYLRLSKGERGSKGSEKEYIIANTFESILGAIFLDLGMKNCKAFVENYLLPHLDEIQEENKHIGPKTSFQEYAQAEKMGTPSYKLVSDEGPDHKKTFVMGAYLDKGLITTGSGNSKQKAESDAAFNAMKMLKIQEEKSE